MNNKEMTLNSERWNYIDLMEFFALFFVIMYHATLYNYNFLSDNKTIYYIRYFTRAIMSTCVPLFFFCNGYLLFNRPFDLQKHIIKTIKIILLTALWGIIGLIIFSVYTHTSLNLNDFIYNLITLNPLGWINHLWFMGILVLLYIFAPLLVKIFKSSVRNFKILLFIFFIIGFGIKAVGYTVYAIGIANNQNMPEIMQFAEHNIFRMTQFYAFPYFTLGGIVFHCKNAILKIKPLYRNLVSVLLIIANCCMLYLMAVFFTNHTATAEPWDIVWCGYDTVFTLLNVCCIFVLSLNYNHKFKLIKNISINTLGIFFIHNIVIRITIDKFVCHAFFQTLIGNIIYVLFVMLLSLVIVFLLGKIPILRKTISLR